MSSAVHRAFFFVFIIAVSTLYAGDKDISKIKDDASNVLNNLIQTRNKNTKFHDSVKASEKLLYALPRVLEYFSEKGFAFRSVPQTSAMVQDM